MKNPGITVFLYECVLRTIKLFSLYKFLIRVLVCDGASSNVALLKVLSGYPAKRLPYSENGNGIKKYFPRMTFKNPFDPTDDNVVHMIITPGLSSIKITIIFTIYTYSAILYLT